MIAGVDRRALRVAALLLGLLVAGVVQLVRSPRDAPSAIEEAYAARSSELEITCAGRVSRILSDDAEGTPHQRFVVGVGADRTVLVAHNLELAARVPLALGDSVEIRGVYEWNDQGGVIHWTHHDPEGGREGGWIRREGETYR